MRIALCNEVIAPMPFPQQCEYAAKLGYDGLEIAPYTLSEEPHRMGAARVAAARAAAEDAGIAVTGLHWLLVKPAGLSISTKDEAVRQKTVDVMLALAGGVHNIEVDDMKAAIDAIGPKVVIPMHYFLPKGRLKILPVDEIARRFPADRVVRVGGPEMEVTPETLPGETRLYILEASR